MAVLANNKENITIGLPKPGGALFWAPLGTALPSSAEAELDGAFVNLGYVTEDGLTNNTEEGNSNIVAWGKDIVINAQENYDKTFTFNLLETARENVLQFVYGKSNVKVNEDNSITFYETGETLPRGILVCDTLQNNGGEAPRIKRQILGDSQFVDRSGEGVYNNVDALNFPVSMKAYKFNDGTKEAFIKTYISQPIS